MALKWFKRKKKADKAPEEVAQQDLGADQIEKALEADEREKPEEETPVAQAPKQTFFVKLRNRLSRTRKAFTTRLDNLLLGKKEIDEKLLEELEEDGWNTVRYQSVPEWAQPTWGSADINHVVLRLLINEAKKRNMYVMLNIAHNFYMYGEPSEGFPGFYIDGHLDDWISQYIIDASPYRNDDNVIFEIVNEYGSNRRVQQTELEQYLNAMIQTLRSEGFSQKIQCNFWWNNKIVKLNDPLNNYMIGLHYYGQSFDRYNPSTPMDFEKACLESGVKSEIQGIFSSSVSISNRLGIPFCVTELGASWTYSDDTIRGGYVYSVGGIAYVMKFLEYAQQYNASVIMHRVGSNSDYEVYYEKATEYFDLDFWR